MEPFYQEYSDAQYMLTLELYSPLKVHLQLLGRSLPRLSIIISEALSFLCLALRAPCLVSSTDRFILAN